MERAVARYRNFLRLHRLHPSIFVVPAFDMDLVWHAHMVSRYICCHVAVMLSCHRFA